MRQQLFDELTDRTQALHEVKVEIGALQSEEARLKRQQDLLTEILALEGVVPSNFVNVAGMPT